MSITARHFQEGMDHSHPDDKMEMATSPYPVAEDIELDGDTVHDPFADNQMIDAVDHTADEVDFMQADSELPYHDDDMLDDEDLAPEAEDALEQDLEMEPYDQDNSYEAEDEILLDEDVPVVAINDETHFPIASEQTTTIEQHIEVLSNTREICEKQEEEEEEELYEDPLANTNHPTTNSTSLHEDHTDTQEQQDPVPNPSVNQEHPTEASDAAAVDHTSELPEVHNELEHNHYTSNQELLVPSEVADIDQALSSNQEPPSAVFDKKTQQQEDGVVVDNRTKEQLPTTRSLKPEEAIEDEAGAPVNLDSHSAIHPVNVEYLGQEMSLFPPSRDDSASTFFLADVSLARKPFDQLLKACRDILADSLEHDDELVLDIPLLGLHICEDSRYASQISLSEVVDVYTVLSRNERTTAPAPLQCLLSSRVCLASQYAYLSSAACEGKAFSEIAGDYMDTPEAEEEHDSEPFGDHSNQVESVSTATNVEADQDQNEVEIDASHASPPDPSAEADLDGLDNNGQAEVFNDRHDPEEKQQEEFVEDIATANASDAVDAAHEEGIDYIPETGEESTSLEEQEGPQTPSSHTLEGDDQVISRTHTRDTAVDYEARDVPSQVDVQNEEDFNDQNGDFLDEQEADIDTANFNVDEQDEDIFATKPEFATESKIQELDGSADFDGSIDQPVADANLGNSTDEFLHLPTTPTKQPNGKRKTIDDDDDLVSFDLDTPEAKRLRP